MIKIADEDLRILMESGYLYLSMLRFQEAQEVFEGVCVLAPKSEVPVVALGNVFCVQGQFDKAIKTYEQALKLAKDSAFALAYLGEALLFKGNETESQLKLTKASELDPKGPSGDFARSLLDLIKKGFAPDAKAIQERLKNPPKAPSQN